MLNRNCFAIALLVVFAASAMYAETGVLSFSVRDVKDKEA